MTAHPHRSKKKPRTATTSMPAPRAAHDCTPLLMGVMKAFYFAESAKNLFQTDAEGLNELYMAGLPSMRRIHDCSACRRFIENFGGLVAITENSLGGAAAGEQIPAMWNPDLVPEFYQESFVALHQRVKRAKVTSVFLTKDKTWGTPETGAWKHMAVRPPSHLVYTERALTAGQAMAVARENVKTVQTALGEFTPAMLDQALRLLESERLARSEKFIGPVRWLRSLHDRPKGPRGHNLLWAAVAAAPEGYCHPRASVIGTLLEDIAAGLDFEDIRNRFNAKLHPLDYQRPQAPPKAGNIKAAEDLVAKLGIDRSLERRYARLDEIEVIWVPGSRRPSPTPSQGGVFGHLLAEAPKGITLPAIPVTWEKFERVVMPNAEGIEVMLGDRAPLIAFTTAEHADAPLIFKWDSPVAWYLYGSRQPGLNGSAPSDWGVRAREWLRVTAIAPVPTMWGEKPKPHLGEGVAMMIQNCLDRRSDQGNALFPETLRDELHGVRSTIEAYSKRAFIGGRESASACGLDIRKGTQWETNVRVQVGSDLALYVIDRWD